MKKFTIVTTCISLVIGFLTLAATIVIGLVK